MKAIIFICLMTQLFGAIYRIGQYGVTPPIYDGKGIVVLDISEFKDDSSIYITINSYNEKYTSSMRYNFAKYSPVNENINLTSIKITYSVGTTSYKHNVSTPWGGYRVYYTYDYHYYFEFKKPTNQSVNYLVMGYNLIGYKMEYIKFDNTRFSKSITTIIIVGSIAGGIILISVIIIFIKKKDDICSCLSSCLCSCSCFDSCSCPCSCSCSPCPFFRRKDNLYAPNTKQESKSFNLLVDSPSTEMKKYDNKDELPEDHRDYIKYSEETPQYCPPPQDNLINKPIPNENIETPTPIFPKNDSFSENNNNNQAPPPQPIEYPSQEIVQNNPERGGNYQ